MSKSFKNLKLLIDLIRYLDEKIVEKIFIANSAIMSGLVFAATRESESKAIIPHKHLESTLKPKGSIAKLS